MTVTLVVAIAEDGVIGREGGLPWRLSTDMKRFKALTTGHPIVMGRKTWESFPKPGPLPGRTNIVVTRDRSWQAEGAQVAHSLEAALEIAAAAPGGEDICVIGGGEVYGQAIGRADRLAVTHVEARVDGDTRFPAIDPAVWHAVAEERVPAGERDEYPTRFVLYERSKGPAAAKS
ncbi:MAG: dihydrofolate reductase [Rhizobiales bacterium]|nr:dihydrofolate reductase [Hyphomicrobiales bacterium]